MKDKVALLSDLLYTPVTLTLGTENTVRKTKVYEKARPVAGKSLKRRLPLSSELV